jgi:hypothetical protein
MNGWMYGCMDEWRGIHVFIFLMRTIITSRIKRAYRGRRRGSRREYEDKPSRTFE